MKRFLATIAVGVAAVGVLAGAAAAGPAPAPGELWSRFPLEPRTAPRTETVPTETVPTETSTPRPAAPSRQVVTPTPDSGEQSQIAWIALGIVAVAAAAAASAVIYKRRPTTSERRVQTRKLEPVIVAQPPARPGVGTAKRRRRSEAPPEPARRRSVAPTEPATPRSEPSLVEMLSPRLHLDEQPEQAEKDGSAPAPPAPGTCEIRWWRGRAESRFYGDAEPPLPVPIESPAFRARGRSAPEKNSSALAAHEVVVQGLAAAGWQPDGHGSLWFSDRFKRVQVGAGAEAAEAAEPAETPARAPAAPPTPAREAEPDPAAPDRPQPSGSNSSFVW